MLFMKELNYCVMQNKVVMKTILSGLICLFFIVLSNESFAQTSRSTDEILANRSKTSTKSKKKFSIFKKKKQSTFKTSDQLQEEYVARMKDNAKRRHKEGKMSDKPQYSDPLYFGHKKKPKKRKNGKKKFCKECQMTH